VVEEDGEPIAFVSLQANVKIEHIYVHPDCAFLGVGTVLIDAIEKLAMGRGTQALQVEATDNAVAFFERLGFRPEVRVTILHGDQWLGGMKMTKTLGAETADRQDGAGPEGERDDA
jgi:putative acetyltransferase